MPVLENQHKAVEENEQNDNAPPTSGPIIGIIYPPPEVRNIVDKTASFVARNGPEFEARIRQNELSNPKFNFLNAGDPYHAYYQHKVKEIREGKSAPVSIAPPAAPKVAAAAAARQQELLKAATAEPEPPREAPPDFEFVADPPSISALDLDVVKLTAQFVARNGRQFLTDLMNREQRNYQFDFLRPQHSLFQYFTRLLEQYTKVLLPPKEAGARFGAEARAGALGAARGRAAWIGHQAKRRAQDEARLERERAAYAAVDWHDFVVVETVDYPPGEPGVFPPPTTPLEVGARVLAQERAAAGDDELEDDAEMQIESGDEEDGLAAMEDRTGARPDDNRVTDMEEDSSSDGSDEDEAPPPPPPPRISAAAADAAVETSQPPRPDRVVVKKYDPKRAAATAAAAAKDEWLVSPITGERIPASKVAEHVRIGLLDPRWLERRDRAAAERSDRDAVLAPGAAIDASLKQLAERRTDIFGVGDEETAIGKKIGEEEKRDERVTWDGHTSSVEAATRAARAHITLEDQIHQIHKVKGLLPDEEKEKIGPKPVPRPAPGKQHQPAPPSLPSMPMMAPPPAARPPLMAPPQFPFPSAPAAAMSMPAPMPMPMPMPMSLPAPPPDDEPASKRARTEDSLASESAWLSRVGRGAVTVSVATPLAPERSEWNLQGQVLPFTLPLTSSVGDLKTLIHNITNMPAAKQKLNFDGLFFKDSNSLAFYNVAPGAVIQMQVKERGGRKK